MSKKVSQSLISFHLFFPFPNLFFGQKLISIMSSQNVNFNLNHFLLQVVDFISSSTTYKNSVFLLSFTPNTIFPMLHEAFDNGWQNLKIVNLILYNLNKKFTKKIRLSDTTFELPLLETIQQSICDIYSIFFQHPLPPFDLKINIPTPPQS